ncbi:hypothetical protein DTO013E5_8409 [Penicillium roqueforti]|uniref:Maintenance of telomere capping protein 6 n=1 Tax=Penicillium roqueforti (strain FM164) TaxID=1365484 RepID=W6QMM9_PENRF|nr:uncharacterized protein LCP9604111_8140 [Penicillium roqueforti]CDM37211.1 unnamed protein product [Penicillium roqueforti FM164]KAF9242232.1 hypothetical protein LCP9604111_8140 [Penicillium roqueforti]KAI1833399.1 hypothetical protein CBS147337_5897 [Penicillium roqueforti]KAI2671809.1 hypothetical protein CBS147355_8452 [Penicillium roqueforti]KAI2675167.1 hypothetical protein LCP963914a_8570 [Penicillium roqueforti]
MSVQYDSSETLLNATWVAVQLSERDVAGQIPLNYVTNPAVALSAACFGNGIYDQQDAAQCFSNLLAIGYRRFVVDLYWSVSRRTWYFCPVSIPVSPGVTISSATSTTKTTTATASADSATITGTDDSNGDTLYELGSYKCTDNLDPYTLAEVLVGYFRDTNSRLTVYTTYLVLNLHVAASASTPNEPASTISGGQLPSGNELAGSILGTALDDFIYSPAQLATDRSNLNQSWYKVDEGYMPITEYFTVHENEAGEQSTPDGWPSSKYIQLAKRDRVLIGYGSIDSQLLNYNLSTEGNSVFPPGYLTSDVTVSATNGTLTSGCLYEPGFTSVSQTNSSWAISSGLPVLDGLSTDETMASLSNVLSGITACGLSPMLNTTLFDQTADQQVEHYRNFSLSSSWAWVLGEPHDANYGGGDGDPKYDRCAIMDLTLNGHWRSTNCTEKRRGACRIGNSPFSWVLSDTIESFSKVSDSCPPGSSFAVPRTGLENTYLYRHLLSLPETTVDLSSADPAFREVFLDFNSIDVTSCWVSNGYEARCPYASDPQQLERKTVLVAAIAGIIILIITALTFFVKCNANRRNSRRRKRVIEGWEYEGVPS